MKRKSKNNNYNKFKKVTLFLSITREIIYYILLFLSFFHNYSLFSVIFFFVLYLFLIYKAFKDRRLGWFLLIFYTLFTAGRTNLSIIDLSFVILSVTIISLCAFTISEHNKLFIKKKNPSHM